jgi:aspartate 1-decarboxylase
MFLKVLKGKLHRARVTGSQIDYPGSIGIDSDMLKAAGINVYEEVLVANVTNGQRVETYVVPAPAGSGEITVLGAAARFFDPGDIIIIMNFAYLTPEELKAHKPKVLACDENNHFKMMD